MAESPVQRTRRLLAEEYSTRGFERCQTNIFFVPQVRSDDAIGWVSVHMVVERDGSHRISPYVGVRHERFQRLVEQLDLGGEHTRCEPSATASLSGVMPGSTGFHWFLERDAAEHEARAMCKQATDAIEQYGFVKMRELLTPRGLVQDLHEDLRDVIAGAIALLLAGDTDAAANVIDQERRRLEQSPAERAGPWGRRFSTFAERFAEELCDREG